MSVDWQSDLYDPLYAVFGTDAVLTIADGTSFDLHAIFDAKALVDGGSVGSVAVQTTRPVADVRMSEITQNAVDLEQLASSTLLLNGFTWIVKSHQLLPGPDGERAGELRLILIDEDA